MPRGYKRSPICANCGREKWLVTPTIRDYPGWLGLPFCAECASRHCRDITQFEPCTNRQAVRSMGEHPARYRDYCERHWLEYGFCPRPKRHKRRCGNPKEVWMPLCWECHGKAEALRLKKLAKIQREREREAREIRAKQRRKTYRYKELKQ